MTPCEPDPSATRNDQTAAEPVRTLVTGATGYVGSRLVAELTRHGVAVTATARDVGKLERFGFPEQVGTVSLDVTDAQSCGAAFDDAAEQMGGPVTAAYFLVHSIGEGDFAAKDLDSAQVFAAAARRAGVARIVYLGGFVPHDEQLSEHLESRADVGDALDDTTVELVWLRAAIILGAGSTSYELIRHIAERVPVIPVPTWMNHPVSPIAVDDVLRYLVAAAEPRRVPAGDYEISCGQNPTYAQLIKAYAGHRRLRRLWLPFPPVPPRLVARIASWLTPLPRELTADLVLSLPNSMTSTENRIRSLVPDPASGMTSVAEALRRCDRPQTLQNVWQTADPLCLTSTDPDWAR